MLHYYVRVFAPNIGNLFSKQTRFDWYQNNQKLKHKHFPYLLTIHLVFVLKTPWRLSDRALKYLEHKLKSSLKPKTDSSLSILGAFYHTFKYDSRNVPCSIFIAALFKCRVVALLLIFFRLGPGALWLDGARQMTSN